MSLSFLFVFPQSHKASKGKRLIETHICYSTNHISFPKFHLPNTELSCPSQHLFLCPQWTLTGSQNYLLLVLLYLCAETFAVLLRYILFLSLVVLFQLYRKHTLALDDHEFLVPSKRGKDFRCSVNIPVEVRLSPSPQILVPHK